MFSLPPLNVPPIYHWKAFHMTPTQQNIEALEANATKLRNDLQALDASIAKMKEEVKEKNKPWASEVHQLYYFITTAGEVTSDVMTSEAPGSLDQRRIEIGNCYASEDAAKKEVERRKVLRSLRELAALKGDAWARLGAQKCKLVYNHHGKSWLVRDNTFGQEPGQVYFNTRADAEAAIAKLGDRLNVLL